MITYYLSGPMRSLADHNHPAFHAVEKAVIAKLVPGDESSEDYGGCEILNPARNFNGDQSRLVNEYMKLDLEMVLSSDVIILLPGWETSEGARREVELATWTGKKFSLAKLFAGNPADNPASYYFENVVTPVRNESPRASVLAEATQLITGDRNNTYGPPTQDFTRTADMATAFGFGVTVNGTDYLPLQGHHVAVFMMMLKTSRLAWSPLKRDSWVDNAGYSGCGYECAVEEAKNNHEST